MKFTNWKRVMADVIELAIDKDYIPEEVEDDPRGFEKAFFEIFGKKIDVFDDEHDAEIYGENPPETTQPRKAYIALNTELKEPWTYDLKENVWTFRSKEDFQAWKKDKTTKKPGPNEHVLWLGHAMLLWEYPKEN